MKLNYFNFRQMKDQMLLTNDIGYHLFLSLREFEELQNPEILDPDSELGKKLIDARMAYDSSAFDFIVGNYQELRRFKDHLNQATSLHIFVVTTACNMRCVYCQANSGQNRLPHIMDEETARKAVDFALQSPNPYLTFEFQGGEPLLNFKIIRYITEYAESRKDRHVISYSIVSNLILLNEEMMDFFKKYNFSVSTSLDGPETVHNVNRFLPDHSGTYKFAVKGLNKLRQNGIYPGAIQTTTRYSLDYPDEIVDSYVRLGFDRIFVRPLTPLGKADKNWERIGYTPEQFLEFYSKILKKVIELNRNGIELREEHAAILLKKIFRIPINYMELRSPCGAGIGQIAYYPDGNIFTCDEGRMLYESGSDVFKIGSVDDQSFSETMKNSICKTMGIASLLESLPSCTDCVYQPYCGTCPVVNYAESEDLIEKHPGGYKCRIYKGMLDLLFEYLQDPESAEVLRKWTDQF